MNQFLRNLTATQQIGALFLVVFGILSIVTVWAFVRNLREHSSDDPEAEAIDADELALSQDHLQRAQAWLEKAAVIAGLVKKPRGRRAAGAASAEDAEALAKAKKAEHEKQRKAGRKRY